MKITKKLGVLVTVPLVAVVVFAGVAASSTVREALAAERLRTLMVAAEQAGELTHQLQRERAVAAEVLSVEAGSNAMEAYVTQRGSTDAAESDYRVAREAVGSLAGATAELVDRVDGQLSRLSTLRDQVQGREAALSAVTFSYRIIIADLISFREAVAQAGRAPAALADQIRAAAAMSRATESVSLQQVAAMRALDTGRLTPAAQQELTATRTSYSDAALVFAALADPQWRGWLDAALASDDLLAAQRLEEAVARTAPGETLQLDRNEWREAMGARAAVLHDVRQDVDTEILGSVTDLRDGERRTAVVQALAVAVTAAAVLGLAVWLARPMIRRLRQLRDAAHQVAFSDLPVVVQRLEDPDALREMTPAQFAERVTPEGAAGGDEIAEVARAFGEVHRAAVRTAAEQTVLRSRVSAMFLNLARRSQSLVDRLISQLDEIERSEDDPKRLSRLFTLDNLATRMRRNDENLLVLAGADSSPPRTDDAHVADVLRAAQSEVEHYDRIEFGTVDDDVSVAAPAVNDVVRLVAELLDNATRYSPPDSSVVVEARRLGDQVIAQIEDRGVGMPQDQASRINAWLAAPPAVEVTTFRKMGLAVVGRLAARQQIRVELRCDPAHGTVAYIALPRSILVLPSYRSRNIAIPAPRSPLRNEVAAAAPPVPPRHLGQLPKRSAAVAHHAAGRGSRPNNAQSRSDLPVAGRPAPGITSPPTAGPPAASTPARASTPPPEATIELPIFREMEAVWFRSHEGLELGRTGATTSSATSYTPSSPTPPSVTPTAARGPAPEPASAAQSSGGPPGRNDGRTDDWQTVADEGWAAAEAAAEPQSGGATRSGLPKRVPKAQLVPGGVETSSGAKTQRRSPDEIRGLLSAYHRGVQRGRESGGR